MQSTDHCSLRRKPAHAAPEIAGSPGERTNRIEPPSREDLALLQGIARSGTLKGAAKAGNTTQPAAARRLVRLERRVSASLVRRDQHGLVLTEAGWGLLQAGNRLLMALGSALRLVSRNGRNSSGGPLPMLRIAAFGSSWSELVDDVAAKVPDMLLSLVNADPDTSVDLFERYTVDAAYVWVPSTLDRACARPMRSEVVVEEPLWMALPADHPQARRCAVSLGDFADDPWLVGASEPAKRLLAQVTRDAGFEPRIAHVAEVSSEMRGLLGHGRGVTLVSPMAEPSSSQGFVLRPVVEPASRKVLLLTDDTVVSDELSRALCTRLRDCYLMRAEKRNPAYTESPDFPLAAHQPGGLESDLDLSRGLAVASTAGESEPDDDALAPEDLHLLRVVGECGSLNRAAPILLITQPALTRRISRLEWRLGLRLLSRGHRGTALTSTARRLLDGASEAETKFGEMLASISGVNRGERARPAS